MQSSNNSNHENVDQMVLRLTSLEKINKDLTERINKMEIDFKSQQNVIENLVANMTKPHYNIEILDF